jgi:hypothetical protein
MAVRLLEISSFRGEKQFLTARCFIEFLISSSTSSKLAQVWPGGLKRTRTLVDWCSPAPSINLRSILQWLAHKKSKRKQDENDLASLKSPREQH